MRNRFSILSLMGLVLLFGVGLAALRDGSFLWLKILYNLTLLSLLLATLAAKCRASSFWFGFAVFGWGYFLSSIGPWPTWLPVRHLGGDAILQPSTNGLLLSGYLLTPAADYLCRHLKPAELGGFVRDSDMVSYNMMMQSYVNTKLITLGITHLLFVFVFAAIGGALARFLARKRD